MRAARRAPVAQHVGVHFARKGDALRRHACEAVRTRPFAVVGPATFALSGFPAKRHSCDLHVPCEVRAGRLADAMRE